MSDNPVKPTRAELADEILDALGFGNKHVHALNLQLRYGKVPTIETKLEIWDDNSLRQLVHVLRRYQVVSKEEFYGQHKTIQLWQSRFQFIIGHGAMINPVGDPAEQYFFSYAMDIHGESEWFDGPIEDTPEEALDKAIAEAATRARDTANGSIKDV